MFERSFYESLYGPDNYPIDGECKLLSHLNGKNLPLSGKLKVTHTQFPYVVVSNRYFELISILGCGKIVPFKSSLGLHFTILRMHEKLNYKSYLPEDVDFSVVGCTVVKIEKTRIWTLCLKSPSISLIRTKFWSLPYTKHFYLPFGILYNSLSLNESLCTTKNKKIIFGTGSVEISSKRHLKNARNIV